ncbi:MAG: hypothetical protein J0L51_03140 [Rhizobiales bacterium]|nr:hypothetical protein [Hyphomicrobiales bacterium]
MRKFLTILAFFSALSLAQAHGQRVGPRGGALVHVGNNHVELVTAEKQVEIFISDAFDKPLAAKGYKALAILAVDGKSVRVTLEPSPDGGKLIGVAPEALPAKVKGAVQLTGVDGKTSTGRIN